MLGFTQGAIIYIDNNVGEQTLRRSMSILLQKMKRFFEKNYFCDKLLLLGVLKMTQLNLIKRQKLSRRTFCYLRK